MIALPLRILAPARCSQSVSPAHPARPQLPVLVFVLHSLLASLHLPLSPFRIRFDSRMLFRFFGLIDAWTQASSRSPPSAFVTLVSVVFLLSDPPL